MADVENVTVVEELFQSSDVFSKFVILKEII